jgi:hypothetical protein
VSTTDTPSVGESVTVTPSPGAIPGVATTSGPAVTFFGTVTFTVPGRGTFATSTGRESGPICRADAEAAESTKTQTATVMATAINTTPKDPTRRTYSISRPNPFGKRRRDEEAAYERDFMPAFGHRRRRRLVTIGLLTLPLALAGWALSGVAQGAGSAPSMEVLPRATGLKYSQTVQIKAHHLPKGSGSVAATICGLQTATGTTIKSPTADDCAGAPEVGKLVIVKSWQSDGEFETNYTLPKSGQKFGKNARFCDKSHRCALVVADANPDAPAYHVDKEIQFVDQKPTTATTKPKPGTTTAPKPAPKPKPTTTTTTQPKTGATASGSASSPAGSATVHAGVTVTPPPSGGQSPPALPLPQPGQNPVPAPVAQALDQACTQLAAAVKQAGGDASALLAACSAIASGSGPQQAQTVLQSPSLLCIAGASAWQNNKQITDACNQAATALAPVTGPIGTVVNPVLNPVLAPG